MNFRELVERAKKLQQEKNELLTAGFFEHQTTACGEMFTFYASFNIEKQEMQYNIIKNDAEVKLLQDLPIPAVLLFSSFVLEIEEWVAGRTENPEFK